MILENYLKVLQEYAVRKPYCNKKRLQNCLIIRYKNLMNIGFVYPVEFISEGRSNDLHLRSSVIIGKKGKNYVSYNGDLGGVKEWLYMKRWQYLNPSHCDLNAAAYDEFFIKDKNIKLIEKFSCIKEQTFRGDDPTSITLSKISSDIVVSNELTFKDIDKRLKGLGTVVGKLNDEYNRIIPDIKEVKTLRDYMG